MQNKYDIESSESLLKEAFRESQLNYINSFVKSLIETEDFSEFTTHTKGLVVEYFTGYINRLVAQIWLYFSSPGSMPEDFFAPTVSLMSRQIAKIKKTLLERKLVSDLMSESAMRRKLDDFFNEHEDRAEFKKAQVGYLGLKQEFDTIIELTKAFDVSGKQMVKSAEVLIETYLRYKEAIFKAMRFDVVLEYYNVDHFNFVYRDSRLQDLDERKKYETIAMNGALKALMPGYNGDISTFEQICASLDN